MLALWATAMLLVGGVGAAFALMWSRYGARPVRVAAKHDGPGCYPRVQR